MAKNNYKEYLLNIDGLEVPIKVYKERRNSIRASLGKTHAILRLPFLISKKNERVQLDKFYSWLKEKVLSKENFRTRFKPKAYKNGYQFSLFDRTFTLKIIESDNFNHSAKYLGDNKILIKLAFDSVIREEESQITLLISRTIGKLYHNEITERVLQINKAYFNKNIKSVKLKYNKSNWGSCSSSSNINLSTRLLFAPEEVQNYVIIHELAHLIEMNHSSRFWKIVSDIMPDYKMKENWLKENGYLCDFGL